MIFRALVNRSRFLAITGLLIVFVIGCTPTGNSETVEPDSAETGPSPTVAVPTPTEVLIPTVAPTTTVEPTVPVVPTPLPTATAVPTATAIPTVTATPVPTATSVPTSTPLPTATPTPTVSPPIYSGEWEWLFPDEIEFSASFEYALDIEYAELVIRYDQVRLCTQDAIRSVRITPPENSDDPYKWTWEMKKTGSIPPGTNIDFIWGLQDVEGNLYEFAWENLAWDDARFEWQQYTKDNLIIEWYSGGDDFGQEVYDRVLNDISRLAIGASVSTPIKALIYEDASTLQGAVLYVQAWTGGLAFTSQNIVLIAIDPLRIETQVSGLTHEIAHLIVAQESDNCIGDIPRWLSEGLATYAEGPITSAYQAAIDDAVEGGSLITIRSLSSSFPADHSRASLSYAQSVSLVTYLIDTYGWEKMTDLLAVFKTGSTYDGALISVYGFDQAALDSAWRVWLSGS